VAKTPVEIRSLARAHTESAIRRLARIMNSKPAPASAQVAATIALLDRGWGKPTQPIAGDKDAPLQIKEIQLVIVDNKSAELTSDRQPGLIRALTH
jgi:hypothetical protein